jgi:acyl carrier protein
MLHTFVGEDLDEVRETCREPLVGYLKTSLDLIAALSRSVGRAADFSGLSEDELDALARQAFDRFFDTSGLLGTPETCLGTVERLSGIGVDEIGCLIDFGVAEDEVLAALEPLARLRRLVEERGQAGLAQQPIAEQLTGHEVTHLQCTPSLAGTLTADPDSRGALGRLRRMLVGGEALPGTLAEELCAAVSGPVHNMYGPTEATVWATTQRLEPGRETVAIGTPMANARAYIVDSGLELVPRGVPGELLLGGPGVAQGYLGQPDLTAQRFVKDPFGSDGRLYRTGDLVRWSPAGELEFLGRMDGQIKLRGHRIELGEIENALMRHADVAEAAAVARGEGMARSIVAYCVLIRPAGADPKPAAQALRSHLAEALPGYMIPSAVVILDTMPRTPNGKIDRNALPEPSAQNREQAAFRDPGHGLAGRIAAVWREVLKIDAVGLDDNFFESGGNSLLIAQLRTRLREETGREFSLVDMFRYPTIGLLAAAIEAESGQPSAAPGDADGAADTNERRRAALSKQGRLRRERRTS